MEDENAQPLQVSLMPLLQINTPCSPCWAWLKTSTSTESGSRGIQNSRISVGGWSAMQITWQADVRTNWRGEWGG